MRKIALVLILLAAAHLDLNAQGTATFHVFPQVADGLQLDGSAYFSSVVAMNVGTKAATCTLRLYGGVASHIRGSTTLTIAASGGVAAKNTSLTDGAISLLATGYATLSCDQPVAAQMGYFYLAPGLPNFLLLGSATVFSSPPTTRAELYVSNIVGFRTAVAIANDTDTAGQYQLNIVNDTGQSILTTSVSVPARSNTAKFLNELVQLPVDFGGGVIISSAPGSGPFSTVGLLYNGSTFLSIAAVPYAP